MKKQKAIFLSPHSDDEILFGCYTLLKEKPLVIICTDSYVQFNRGENITAEQRIEETKEAMKLVGCRVEFLHIRDDQFTEDELIKKLSKYKADVVYAPRPEAGGNIQHNFVGNAAKTISDNVIFYKTYTDKTTRSRGSIYLIPTDEYRNIKEKALQCYKSQLAMSNRAYFEDENIINWESYD